MFVPTPIQPPESPRVRELSQQIQQLLSDFQRRYPMTPAEIRRALLHAAGATGGGRRPLAVVLAAGVAAALGIGVFASRIIAGGGETRAFPIMFGVGVAVAAVGLVVAITRSR